MPGKVTWYDAEKTIQHHQYVGEVALDDYYAVVDDAYRLMREQSHPVHVIHDRTHITRSPSGAVTSVMRYASQRAPENLGISVIVGGSLMMRVMVDIGRRVAPRLVKDVYFANDLQSAVTLIMDKTSASLNEQAKH